MGVTLHVLGYDANGDRLIDTVVEDETDEGPDFYAFKVLHATGVVVCAQVFPFGEPGEVVTALVTTCDPGVEFSDIFEAGL
jgi:hypothetical protein